MQRLLKFIRDCRYEMVAVADGMIVMMLELVGSRLIAPHLGTSTYVWTAIIGVILGALALGNWYGGKLADRGPSTRMLATVFIIAAAILLGEMVIQSRLIAEIASLGWDLRLLAFMTALLIFAPPAMLMGVVSPYLAKLRLTSLEHAGQSVGRLYAAGTAGSILGTFLAGYFLIGAVGSRTLGYMLVVALILTSFLVMRRGLLGPRLSVIALGIMIAWVMPNSPLMAQYTLLYDGDSSYSRYLVLDDGLPASQVRYLMTDNQGIQSGVDLAAPNQPLFDYTKRFVEAAAALPAKPQRILMIGGGTFTVPTILHNNYPDAQIDVVEIDPALTRIAERYFGYMQTEKIRIINQDGRYFLNQATADRSVRQYDLIYMDAFSSLTPPFQLTTREAAGRLNSMLRNDGLLVVNLVATPAGPAAGFANASTATYASIFTNTKWYQANSARVLDERQNTILLANKNKAVMAAADTTLDWREISRETDSEPMILTDDKAPVEQLTSSF